MASAYDTPQPQMQSHPQHLTLRALRMDRDSYNNYPPFQRAKVWPDRFKRMLIDTILRGLPVPPLLAFRDRGQYWIIDGQQRLTTILDYMAGYFTTSSMAMNKREEPNSLPPVQPKRTYQQLDEAAQSFFDSYTIIVNVLESIDLRTAGLLFRRLQNQHPLTTAEKLASYQSQTLQAAESIATHPIWTEMYMGETRNKQVIQGSVVVIALELAQEYTSLQPPRLKELAAGLKDTEMTADLLQTIMQRLDVVKDVFDGTTFFQRVEIIPLYQAVLFLEKQGYEFTTSQIGCLTPWFAKLQVQVEAARKHGIARLFSQLVGTNAQKLFWDDHLAEVKSYCERPQPAAQG
jgi:Protein of unknown function DUF262